MGLSRARVALPPRGTGLGASLRRRTLLWSRWRGALALSPSGLSSSLFGLRSLPARCCPRAGSVFLAAARVRGRASVHRPLVNVKRSATSGIRRRPSALPCVLAAACGCGGRKWRRGTAGGSASLNLSCAIGCTRLVASLPFLPSWPRRRRSMPPSSARARRHSCPARAVAAGSHPDGARHSHRRLPPRKRLLVLVHARGWPSPARRPGSGPPVNAPLAAPWRCRLWPPGGT